MSDKMPTSACRPYLSGAVRGFLHEPLGAVTGGLVLTHGAGLNCQAPLLIAIAGALAQLGVCVLRCDLPFRQKRPTGPPLPASAREDRDGLKEAVVQLSTLICRNVCLGGHSYGGRQSSILVTEPDAPALKGLFLLSYPLHPPRKPEQLRTSHFSQLRTSCLFIHGTRDSFGSPSEMKEALRLLPISTLMRLVLMEGAGHELSPEKPTTSQLCAKEFLHFFGVPDRELREHSC